MALIPTDHSATNRVMTTIMAVVTIGLIWFLVNVITAPSTVTTNPTTVEQKASRPTPVQRPSNNTDFAG